MKTISLILIALITLAGICLAETTVSGTVEGKWTKEGSPYRATGDLTVAKGNSLWIEPGVDVIFDGPYSLTVEGSLVAGKEKGLHLSTKDKPPVKFTTDLGKNAAGWGGIKFTKAGDDNVLVNCVIEHARSSGDGGGIYCDHSDVSITNTTIQDCRAEGRGGAIYGDKAELALTNCAIKDNRGAAGGAIFALQSELVSTNDNFENNSVGGISLLDKSEGVLTNSTLKGSGIICRGSELVITNGTIDAGADAALSCTEHSSAVVTNATLKGGKGLDRDESSDVVTTNVNTN